MKSEKITKNMEEILTIASVYLSEIELKNVKHFLGHNEIGIAFSELCGALVEGDIIISEELKKNIILMYDYLDGDDDEFWNDIKLREYICKFKTK